MSHYIREGVQQFLDEHSDGWSVAHYVLAVGLERVVDGEIETAAWMYADPSQPTYVTEGLLLKAEELQHCVAEEDTE